MKIDSFAVSGAKHMPELPQNFLDNAFHYSDCSGMFTRRLGLDPHANGAMTPSLRGCPDILEMESGDFAIIGKDITEQAASRLFAGASCGPDERIVCIPRTTLVLAKADIPEQA